ncbi:hypothetical protein [Bacillus atrophaeus]|uniref:hypothetical protein n=1 Tax=Bacillus atrophaeus TaxID=1452 RepID=UPI00039F1428|nr:hypothetical protein [Bacillus atrophaeus]
MIPRNRQEISWIHEILGEKVFHPDYVSLKASAIKQLSMDYRSDVVEVINSCGEEDGVYSG